MAQVKKKTGNTLRISANDLNKLGTLLAGSTKNIEWTTSGRVSASMQVTAYADSVVFNYAATTNGTTHQVNDTISLERTPCHFGGSRVWFKCPSCGKRAYVLYLGGNGNFSCRTCHNLAYNSQCESKIDRSNARLTKYRKRLNWYGSHEPYRPHYMHKTTYQRLSNEAVALYGRSTVMLLRMFERLNKRLARR
jgi:hypothetical protein